MRTKFTVHHNEHVSSRPFEEVVSAFESAVGSVEDTGFPPYWRQRKAPRSSKLASIPAKARAASCVSSRSITGPGWRASD